MIGVFILLFTTYYYQLSMSIIIAFFYYMIIQYKYLYPVGYNTIFILYIFGMAFISCHGCIFVKLSN